MIFYLKLKNVQLEQLLGHLLPKWQSLPGPKPWMSREEPAWHLATIHCHAVRSGLCCLLVSETLGAFLRFAGFQRCERRHYIHQVTRYLEREFLPRNKVCRLLPPSSV